MKFVCKHFGLVQVDPRVLMVLLYLFNLNFFFLVTAVSIFLSGKLLNFVDIATKWISPCPN